MNESYHETTGMAYNHDFPEEMMLEILHRLPVESLLRFQLVCKSWLRVINHPKFVAKHLLHSQQQTQSDAPNSSATVLLRRFVEKESGEKENVFSFLTYPVTDDDQSVVDIGLPCFKDCRSLEICGHSHGIVCISDIDMDIVLCNPTTREFRRLPQSILLFTELPEELDSCTGAVGFGYDPKSNDFKVVRVVKFMEAPNILHPSRVEVYNLSTDCWREIQTPLPADVFWSPSFLMYHRGSYYWWAFCDHTRKEVIQSFDMSDEEFSVIPLPESFEVRYENYRSVGLWKGSIVLFHYPFSGNSKHFDMWVMGNNESGGISWSKLLRIGPISELEMPLLVVNSEEVIMEAGNGKVVVYNLNTNELKNLPVEGHPHRFQATFFIKSLLSVKGGTRLHLGATAEII